MREIKFRAWNPENNTMVDFDNEKAANDAFIAKHLLMLMANKHSLGKDLLMQFTGLQDKNGIDIYEGDILYFHHEWSSQPNKEVVFNDDFHSYALLSSIEKEWVAKGSNHYKYWSTDEDNIYFLHEVDGYEVEVIGNIHQNPELLS